MILMVIWLLLITVAESRYITHTQNELDHRSAMPVLAVRGTTRGIGFTLLVANAYSAVRETRLS